MSPPFEAFVFSCSLFVTGIIHTRFAFDDPILASSSLFVEGFGGACDMKFETRSNISISNRC